MTTRKGFTLIELLVVMAIIALLSSVVLATLARARLKSRDARRFSDIGQLMIALELYNDAKGHYPDSSSCGVTTPNGGWCNSAESLDANGHWIYDGATADALAPYLPKDPLDPVPRAASLAAWPVEPGVYFYYSDQSAQFKGTYMIVYRLENYPNPIELTDGMTDCLGITRDYGNDSNGIITIGQSCPR
jgi:prepilin-type N-terminal cleavage/methylation domain-containing protein